MGTLIDTCPRRLSMSVQADVSPIYLGVVTTLSILDQALPPELKIPAIEEIQYILQINTPGKNSVPPIIGGRLWQMINGLVPK